MITIGSGNVGMLLATKFDEKSLLLSTAHQDTINFKKFKVNTFSDEGAAKRFNTGIEIWEQNFSKLESILSHIKNDKVIIFSSLGGGSGSSSLNPISKILLNQNNKILIISVLPYKKEMNPSLANSVQAVNNLTPLMSNVSVMILDNERLKKIFEDDWVAINKYIIHKTDYIINLIEKHSTDDYSPVTIDQSELESVVFGGGFLDYSDTFLEESNPKFEYGSLDKNIKNCLLAMYIDTSIVEDEILQKYHSIFTQISSKIAGRVSNSRFISGIIRGELKTTNSLEGIKDRAYIIVASGLNVEKYTKKIGKLRDVAIKKASVYMEKKSSSRIIDNKENKILNI